MWELEQGSPGRPTSVKADPCDPGTVEQTQSEITHCSIKGWGLKVSFVLIGCKSIFRSLNGSHGVSDLQYGLRR